MKRSTRQQLAKETVAIVERGRYESRSGVAVSISGLEKVVFSVYDRSPARETLEAFRRALG